MFPTPLTYARYTNVTIARAIKAATPPRRFMTFPPPALQPALSALQANSKRRVRKIGVNSQ